MTSHSYWDCCKPSCGWPDKADVSAPVRTCLIDGSQAPYDAASGCERRGEDSAYMCADNQPWAVTDDFSFGFVSTSLERGSEKETCCACYEYVLNPSSFPLTFLFYYYYYYLLSFIIFYYFYGSFFPC